MATVLISNFVAEIECSDTRMEFIKKLSEKDKSVRLMMLYDLKTMLDLLENLESRKS